MAAPHSKYKRKRDTRQAQQALRAKDTRVQSALAKARDEEAELTKRIIREAAEAELAAAERAAAAAQALEQEQAIARLKAAKERVRLEAERAAKRIVWPLGQARSMYRQGYTLEHCVERTGWDAADLADARMVDVVANSDTFPCEECGIELIHRKPDEAGILTCPRCGHKEAV